MIKLKQAVVVEGRYDKNALRQLIDAPIFETSGFGVMKNRELVSLLRLAAEWDAICDAMARAGAMDMAGKIR